MATYRLPGPDRVDLYYEDHGSGPAVVLVHGWPLDSGCWAKQVPVLLEAGYRVVYYDRRGFGRSSRPVRGFDFDTLADDLDALLCGLDLREVALLGFSMGTGECIRYLRRHGSSRVRAMVLLAALPPCLVQGADNPDGIDPVWLDGLSRSIIVDRQAFAGRFFRDYYSADQLDREPVGDEVLAAAWSVMALVPATTLTDCVRAWLTDFRGDLSAADVPVLVVHGDDDRIYPIAATGLRLHQQLPRSRWLVIEGGPHGLLWTHAATVNRALQEFLGRHMNDSVR